MTRTSIEGLFPTPVAFYRWDEGLNDKEIKFIQNLETRPNDDNTTSKDSYLFKRKELRRIKLFAQQCVDDYVGAIYAPITKTNLYTTQAWSNYTKPGQYHHKHRHQNSIVSGVFYVNANRDDDRIKFFDGKTHGQNWKVHTENWNTYNSESWWFSVETNMLILFPSTLEHMVETVKGDHERVSLAFNTFWRGEIGNLNELTHLQLD